MNFPRVLTHLWLLILAGAVGAQTAGSPSVVTAYFSDRPPFCLVDGQTGILISLTKAILAEAGVKARFIELPSNRIVEMLRYGQPEALGVGWYRDPGKDPPGRFSLPFYQESPVVVVMNARMAALTNSPLKMETLLASGFTLGLKAGTSLGPALDQKIRAQGLVPLETGASIPEMLNLILGGRMDYTLLSAEEAQYLLKTDPRLSAGLVTVKLLDAPPGNFRYFIYPEGFDPVLADKIDAAIERLKNQARSPSVRAPTARPDPVLPDLPAPVRP